MWTTTRRILLIAALICGLPALHGATPIHTFSIPAGSFSFDTGGGYFETLRLFTGAAQAQPGNTFALAYLNRGSFDLKPLAPERLGSLNQQNGVPNPLFGAKIAFLNAESGAPVAVKDGEPSTVYVLNNLPDIAAGESLRMFSATVNDAGGEKPGVISGLAGAPGNFFATISGPSMGVAVVRMNTRTITETVRSKDPKKKDEKKERSITELITTNADPANSTGTNRAVPVTVSTDALKIDADLASVSINDIYWNRSMGCLYVGLSVESGATGGARSVMLGRLVNNKLRWLPLAPATAFDFSGDQIVGTTGSAQQLRADRLRSMITSSNIHCLIVQSDASVYALPVVSKAKNNPNVLGTLADVTQSPDVRTLTVPATTPDQLYRAGDLAALVGGAPVPLNTGKTVSDLFVVNDAVYVAVGEQYLLTSQALFDERGFVAAWTPWARASATGDPNRILIGGMIDPCAGTTMQLIGNSSLIAQLSRTQWGANKNDGIYGGTTNSNAVALTEVLGNLVTKDSCTINNLVEFGETTPGFNQIPGNQMSLLVTLGNKQITLIETSRNGVPAVGDFGKDSGRVATLNGGALNDVGALVTAAIVTDGSQFWLVVGGTGGLAILADPVTGNGWTTPLVSLAELLNSGFVFQKIGDYSFVRKIIASQDTLGSRLYVLTDTTFDRLELTTSQITGRLMPVVLATQEDIPGSNQFSSLTDVFVSGPLAVLGTTAGLVRVANNSDIRLVTMPTELGWQRVALPESLLPVVQIFAQTAVESIFGFPSRAQLYVLTGIRPNAARVNRMVVNLDAGVVTDSALAPMRADFYILNKPSYYLDFGQFVDCFFTDGILYATHAADGANPLFLGLRGVMLNGGTSFIGREFNRVPFEPGDNACFINCLMRSSVLGNYLISGDFGLRTNE